MKKVSLLVLASIFLMKTWAQPCTTTNAAGCDCPDGSDTCRLLPDLNISWFAILDYSGGPDEFSQTGNGADDGRLRITGATPNIGYGSFTVRGTDYFLCGTDTIIDPNRNPNCSNGYATNMLQQRIYKKMGNTMTYEDRFTGGQTFHPTHGHNHVDDWVSFTLRVPDANNPDTLSWEILGQGAKIGFCLMDYNSCNDYPAYCKDHQVYMGGNDMSQPNFPNYGLGGGQYNCSPVEQGISSGWMDIYSEYLDGMWIDIPPTVCNGDYWIIAQVDPLNNFEESNENNNWTAVPITLTKQLATGNAIANIDVNGNKYLCNNETVTLTASPASSYLWSNGATTQSINVSDSGNYTVATTSICGNAVSSPIEIFKNVTVFDEIVADTSCQARPLILSATGDGSISWYDAPNGNVIGNGNTFETPVLNSSTTYYAELHKVFSAQSTFSEPHVHNGSSLYSGTQYNGYVIFDALQSFNLKSVKVYSEVAATRIIELRDVNGVVIESATLFIDTGISRINLDFQVPAGIDLQLGTNTDNNLTLFGYESPRLRRSGSNVSYPYVLPNYLSLKDSPYGASYYYYFYDWELYTEVSCTSPRVPVTALINNLPVVNMNTLNPSYNITDNIVTLYGFPAGGVFSGTGVSGNTFSPAAAGVGGPYTITYTYTESGSGCYNAASSQVMVIESTTSIKNLSDAIEIEVYPNPAKDYLNISFQSDYSKQEVSILNVLGEKVISNIFTATTKDKLLSLEVKNLAKGVYFGEVKSGSQTFNFRFVKP